MIAAATAGAAGSATITPSAPRPSNASSPDARCPSPGRGFASRLDVCAGPPAGVQVWVNCLLGMVPGFGPRATDAGAPTSASYCMSVVGCVYVLNK